MLLGLLEEQLHAHAGAEERHSRRGRRAQQPVELELMDDPHRRRERPDARQEDAVGGQQDFVVAADDGAGPDALQRLLDRTAVPHPVIDDGDQRRWGGWPRRHVVRVPLVEGTPVSVGSIDTARRSARAKALKAASIM